MGEKQIGNWIWYSYIEGNKLHPDQVKAQIYDELNPNKNYVKNNWKNCTRLSPQRISSSITEILP